MTRPPPAPDQTAVRDFFTAHAQDYSNLFRAKQNGSHHVFRQRLTLARQMTAGTAGRILDCACGSGEVTAAVLESGRFTGGVLVDLSPRMLELARQEMTRVLDHLDPMLLEFRGLDIFELIAGEIQERFDLVLCLGLVAHTGRLEELLQGLHQLLRPKGKILLQSTLLDHPGTKVVRMLTARRYYRRQGYRISYYRHNDILRAAENANLDMVAMRRFGVGFPLGDRLWAGMNFRLEQSLQGWASAHGAEALYLLEARG